MTGRPRARSCPSTGSVTCSCPSRRPTPAELGIGIGSPVVVRCGRRQLTVPYLDTFAAGAPGEIIAFTDSAGLISLAINAGDAAAAARAAARSARPALAGARQLRSSRASNSLR